MAKASASEEKDSRVKGMVEGLKKPKGKLRSIHIAPAENGYTVETSREEAQEEKSGKEGSGDSPVPAYQPPKAHVFPDKAGVIDHIEKHLD